MLGETGESSEPGAIWEQMMQQREELTEEPTQESNASQNHEAENAPQESEKEKIGTAALEAEKLQSQEIKSGKTGADILQYFDENYANYRDYIGNEEEFERVFAPDLRRLKGIAEKTIAKIGGENANTGEIPAEAILDQLRQESIIAAQEIAALTEAIDSHIIYNENDKLREATRKKEDYSRTLVDLGRVYNFAKLTCRPKDDFFNSEKTPRNGAELLDRIISDIDSNNDASNWADNRLKNRDAKKPALDFIQQQSELINLIIDKSNGNDLDQISTKRILEACEERRRNAAQEVRASDEEVRAYRKEAGFVKQIISDPLSIIPDALLPQDAKKYRSIQRKNWRIFSKMLQENKKQEILKKYLT